MILAKRNKTSDVHLIVSNDKQTFFCIHTDRTRFRLWEPAIQMNVNEAYHHVQMHITLGHKVPEGLCELVRLQYMLQD